MCTTIVVGAPIKLFTEKAAVRVVFYWYRGIACNFIESILYITYKTYSL